MIFFYFYPSKFGGKLVFTSNLARKYVKSFAVKDTFLQELIELWTDLNYRDSFASRAEFGAQRIWNNSMIRIAGKTIFYKHWVGAGVRNINDLLTNDSKLMTYSCFRKKFYPTVSFFEYYGVSSAINSINKPSQLAYKIFINQKCTCSEKRQAKWIRDCESEDVENLE